MRHHLKGKATIAGLLAAMLLCLAACGEDTEECVQDAALDIEQGAQDAAPEAESTELTRDDTETREIKMDGTFTAGEIPESVWERMQGKSYKDNCTIPREELRYLQVSYVNYDGESSLGEIVCNQAIADDLLEIFEALYEAEYRIASIRLVDDFDADDELSMEADNCSAFNFRCIAGTDRLSNHSLGMAIDINPFYNPYVNRKGVITPIGSEAYTDRTADFEHKITHDDLAYQLFTAHGFTWGGDWDSVKDYQHFEKEIKE